jgi:hypothetical protein
MGVSYVGDELALNRDQGADLSPPNSSFTGVSHQNLGYVSFLDHFSSGLIPGLK